MAVATGVLAAWFAIGPAQAATRGSTQPVDTRDLREWLTYIASDDLHRT